MFFRKILEKKGLGKKEIISRYPNWNYRSHGWTSRRWRNMEIYKKKKKNSQMWFITHRNLEQRSRSLCFVAVWNANRTWIYAHVRPNLGWRLSHNVGVWPDFPRLFIESKFRLDRTLFRRNNISAEDTRQERARIDIFEPIFPMAKPDRS